MTRRLSILFIFCFLLFKPSLSFSIVEHDLTNLLGNPSFELDLNTSPTKTLQDGVFNPERGGVARVNWDNSPNRGISTPTVAGAPDGSRVLQLSEPQLAAGTAGAFTFQAIAGAIYPGDFVSFSAIVRLTALDGGDDVQVRLEFRDANGNLLAAVNTASGLAAGTPFNTIIVNGTVPTGTVTVSFVIRLAGAIGVGGATVAQIDRAVGTISSFPINLDASASKINVTKGSATFISSRIKNVSSTTFANLEVVVNAPEGFTFIDSSSRLDGIPASPRTEGGKVFPFGVLQPEENKKLGFLLAASSIIQVGKRYEVSFFVRQTNGTVRSATKSIVLTVIADPLFEEGIVVGKVFDDQNENKNQDEGEHGIPGVKLATEEGIVVVTDPHGRFHIPGVKPGRHVVKIDGHTLPKNTKFVTEESVLIRSTEGMFNVVNFAAKLPEPQIPKQYRDQLQVFITPGSDVGVPELSIEMEPDILRMGLGYFEKDPILKIHTNYPELIYGWRIEVRNELGEEIWTGYGLGPPPREAPWTGKTKSREPIEKGLYSYRLIVRDREGHEDWTRLKFFRIISKLDPHMSDEPKIEVPAVGHMNMARDGRRSIPIEGRPTLSVRGTTFPWNTISVNGESVGVNLDGTFQTQLHVPPGKQSVVVTTTDPEGNSVAYQEEVIAKDSYFFVVALGEEELGANITNGSAEVVGRDDKFHRGFYEDGRLAYYLKAKIKGKALITSKYDTDDPRRALFTNLDPDQYYPVYGDDSEIYYDGYDTKQRFYLLVEMDRSSIKWGSYHTDFTDTQLATHNRTFSGLKARYETLSSTRYGDAKRGFVVFTADSDQLADHNEFAGTGGSLFYLRNRNVIQGSEKVKIEVRDKIQATTVLARNLVYGTDYEIDYNAGRIILRKPLSAVSYSDTIISNDILNGSETYLIVDYEFDPQGFVSDRSSGARGFMHMGDHIRIGGTAIEDRRPDRDYDLRGVDLVTKFGRNTKVTAEYARSQDRTIRNAVSYNGGITFEDLLTGNTVIKKTTQLFDDAYLIKAETKLKTRTEVSGYAQQINAGFANADLIRQAGTRKAGIEIRQKAGEHVQMSYRFDRQKATDPDNTANLFVTSPEEQKVHTAQVKMDYDKYLAIAEYRSQRADTYSERDRAMTNALDDVAFGNALALKAGYRVYPDLMPYAKAQTSFGGKREPNHQFGAGVEATVLKGKGTVYIEEMAGTIGDSTQLGFNVRTSDTANVYSSLRTGPDPEGQGRELSTTIGSSSQVNSKSRFYSEREVSSFRTGERLSNILGYDTKLNERWSTGVSFERGFIRDITEINSHRNAGALEVSYVDRDILKIVSRYELRYEGALEDRIQWLFRDTVDWKLSEDYRFSARLNRSDTNHFSASAFRTDASFTEFNMGLAYRPVRHNRLNVLTRYTWLEDVGAESQFNTPDIFGIETEETAHIFGLEFGYDLLPSLLGLVEKAAYRRSSITAEGDSFYIGHFLWVHRFNFHVVRKWDLALEYRMLWDLELLDSMKHGALVELDREIMNYIRFGVGYNFTDFDDDLRTLNDFSAHGIFTRVSGKF